MGTFVTWSGHDWLILRPKTKIENRFQFSILDFLLSSRNRCWHKTVTMVFLPINEYHSLFDFLFNVDLTKLRSLRVTFLSYTRENDEMFLDTRLLISRGKKERKNKNWHRFSIFNLDWKLNGRMTHGVRVSFVHFILNLERRWNFTFFSCYLSIRLGFLKQNCRTVEKTLTF